MTICTTLAKQITDYVQKNKKMPKLLKIDGVGYNQNHMAYRLAYGVCNELKDAKPFHIDNAKDPKGNKLNHKIYRGSYVKFAKNYCKFVETHKQTPNYVSFEGKKIAVILFIYEMARIVNRYRQDKEIPLYCTFDSAHVRGTTTQQENKDKKEITKDGWYWNPRCLMGGEEKQYTTYYCADVTIMQICYELFGLDLSQSWIASIAGTTTLGTSHEGINQALSTIAKKYGYKIDIEWKSFDDVGWKQLAEYVASPKVGIGIHHMWHNDNDYNDMGGHYTTCRGINLKKHIFQEIYSLSGASLKNRSFKYMEDTMNEISQPSVLIVTRK